MTESSTKKAERLQDFLASGDRGAFEAAVIASMEVLVEAQAAIHGLMDAVAEGTQTEDALVLIAGLQRFHDASVKMVAREDNGVQHTVEVRPGNFVTRTIDRATSGEYRIATCDNFTVASFVNRALAAGLRRRADEILAHAKPPAPEEDAPSAFKP